MYRTSVSSEYSVYSHGFPTNFVDIIGLHVCAFYLSHVYLVALMVLGYEHGLWYSVFKFLYLLYIT